jgi:hypothetical protein
MNFAGNPKLYEHLRRLCGAFGEVRSAKLV